MTSKLEIKDFSAWEDRQPGPGREPTLHVAGKVRISNTNQKPRLVETVPPGINPTILLLDLTLETEGVGIKPVDPWASVKFQKSVSKGQYEQVEIRSDGQSIATLAVKVVS